MDRECALRWAMFRKRWVRLPSVQIPGGTDNWPKVGLYARRRYWVKRAFRVKYPWMQEVRGELRDLR